MFVFSDIKCANNTLRNIYFIKIGANEFFLILIAHYTSIMCFYLVNHKSKSLKYISKTKRAIFVRKFLEPIGNVNQVSVSYKLFKLDKYNNL